ncbi:MAG: hypothetical protein ABI728_12935 [Betaproteobacteria bacterium]
MTDPNRNPRQVHFARGWITSLVSGVLDLAEQFRHQRAGHGEIEFLTEIDAAEIRFEPVIFGEQLRLPDEFWSRCSGERFDLDQ